MKTIRRTRFDAAMEKRSAVEKADAAGELCDSVEVRTALLERVARGEITGPQAQEELKRIKREGKRSGKLTRSQAFSRA